MDFIKTRDEDETANLIWNDSAVQHEKIAELRNYQVHYMAALYDSLDVGEESLKIRMPDFIAALNRKMWILTFTVGVLQYTGIGHIRDIQKWHIDIV